MNEQLIRHKIGVALRAALISGAILIILCSCQNPAPIILPITQQHVSKSDEKNLQHAVGFKSDSFGVYLFGINPETKVRENTYDVYLTDSTYMHVIINDKTYFVRIRPAKEKVDFSALGDSLIHFGDILKPDMGVK